MWEPFFSLFNIPFFTVRSTTKKEKEKRQLAIPSLFLIKHLGKKSGSRKTYRYIGKTLFVNKLSNGYYVNQLNNVNI